jgi:hypothetical protein
MADYQKKRSAVIAKDSTGSLIQMMPQTRADLVKLGSGNLETAIDPLSLRDVKEMQTEIIPQTLTETETRVENIDKYLLLMDVEGVGDYLSATRFSIELGFGYLQTDSSTGETYPEYANVYTVNESDAVDGCYSSNIDDYPYRWIHVNRFRQLSSNVQNSGVNANGYFKSNTEYYLDFQLDSSIIYESMSFVIWGTLMDEMKDEFLSPEYIQNVYYNSIAYGVIGDANESAYKPWGEYESIEIVLPEEGETKSWMLNASSAYDDNIIPISQRNMRLSLTGLGNSKYRAIFKFELSRTVVDTTVTKWTDIKTTLVKNDDTSVEIVKPMSGILRNIEGSASFDVVSSGETIVPDNPGTLEATIVIADGREITGEYVSPLIADEFWPMTKTLVASDSTYGLRPATTWRQHYSQNYMP